LAKSPCFSGVWRKSHAKVREVIWEMRGRAAADLLREDLPELVFDFASVFHEPGGILAGVRIEFKTRVGGSVVWVDVMQGEPRNVVDQRRGRR